MAHKPGNLQKRRCFLRRVLRAEEKQGVHGGKRWSGEKEKHDLRLSLDYVLQEDREESP